jgi:hypothetical protein
MLKAYRVLVILIISIFSGLWVQAGPEGSWYKNFWHEGEAVQVNNLRGSIITTINEEQWGVSGAKSKNYLGSGESGEIKFNIHEKFMGFVGWSTNTHWVSGFSALKVGILFGKENVSVLVDGKVVSELSGESYNEEFKIVKNGSNNVKVYYGNELVYSVEEPLEQTVYTHIGLSSPKSRLSNCKVSYKYENQIDNVVYSGIGASSSQGQLTVSYDNGQHIYPFWDDNQPMTSSQYTTYKNRLASNLNSLNENLSSYFSARTYSTYLSEQKKSLSSKKTNHIVRLYDSDDGSEDVYEIKIPQDIKYSIPSGGISDNEGYFQKTEGNTWSNSNIPYYNGILETEGAAEVSIPVRDLSSEYVLGLREYSHGASSTPTDDYYYGLYIKNSILTLVKGYELSSNQYNLSIDDEVSIQIVNGKIKCKINGLVINQSEYIAKDYLLDLVLKTGSVAKLEPFEDMCYIPRVTFDGNENLCGMNFQEITKIGSYELDPRTDNLPNVSSSMEWRDSKGEIVSTTHTLNTNESGIYWFHLTVGLTAYYPQMVVVGYDVQWADLNNVVTQPTSNSLQTTLPTGQSNITGSGKSINKGMITNGADQFIYTEIKKSINQLGSSDPTYSDVISMSLNPVGGISGLMYIYNEGVDYKMIFYPANSNFFIKDVEDGDHLLTISDGSTGQFKYYINGLLEQQTVGTYNTSPTLTDITGGISKNWSSTHPFNSSSVLYNCITSLPCPEIVYYELKRKLNAEYFWAYTNKVTFRYVEEYNQQSNNLSYEIVGKEGTVLLKSATPTDPQLQKVFGDNRFILDLNDYRSALNPGFYTLKIKNEKGETRFLKFKLD